MTDPRAQRLAENEALAREVNERVGEVSESWLREDEPVEFVCECSLDECSDRIHLRMAEYRQVRTSPVRFAMLREHLVPEIEVVVGEAGDAVIVEKLGPGQDVAEETAP
jgi:hypothetical protein